VGFLKGRDISVDLNPFSDGRILLPLQFIQCERVLREGLPWPQVPARIPRFLPPSLLAYGSPSTCPVSCLSSFVRGSRRFFNLVIQARIEPPPLAFPFFFRGDRSACFFPGPLG